MGTTSKTVKVTVTEEKLEIISPALTGRLVASWPSDVTDRKGGLK